MDATIHKTGKASSAAGRGGRVPRDCSLGRTSLGTVIQTRLIRLPKWALTDLSSPFGTGCKLPLSVLTHRMFLLGESASAAVFRKASSKSQFHLLAALKAS